MIRIRLDCTNARLENRMEVFGEVSMIVPSIELPSSAVNDTGDHRTDFFL